MRIGIDARTILNPEKGDDSIGTGHYTYQLIRHLLDIDKENEYVIFFDSKAREKDIKKFTRANTKIVFFPFSDYERYLPGIYDEILETATLQKEDLDILHSTSSVNRIPFAYKGKTVVTYHDLGVYKIPECFPRWRRIKEKAVLSLMAKKADKIIALSNSGKKDLVDKLKISENKIRVINSGLDRRFFQQQGESRKVTGKYGITKKYILFLGTIEASKNISKLLKAFAKFKKKHVGKNGGKKFKYQLVLAGKRGWMAHEYVEQARRLGIFKDIVFTGYIIGDELVPLFKGAEFFIMPSLYEGFGMTVLEAFATEAPAIISKVSSLPEVAGDAAYYVDPSNTSEISEAMWNFSQDENLRNQYKERGLEQARKFDWEKTAKETFETYKLTK